MSSYTICNDLKSINDTTVPVTVTPVTVTSVTPVTPPIEEKADPFVFSMRTSSNAYRQSSNIERTTSNQVYNTNFANAQSISQTEGVSFDVAMTRLNSRWSEDKWARIPINSEDSKVGDVFTTTELSICCNSKLDGMYNDTVAATVGSNATCVTFSNKHASNMVHSGDIITPFGLRHNIKYISTNWKTNQFGYILSTPWINGKACSVTQLSSTVPVLEIRTEDVDGMKRFIIPQDFTDGGKHTACVSAMVKFVDGLWTITLVKNFIMGFADDTKTIICELMKLSNLPQSEIDEFSHSSHNENPVLSLFPSLFPLSSCSTPQEPEYDFPSFPSSSTHQGPVDDFSSTHQGPSDAPPLYSSPVISSEGLDENKDVEMEFPLSSLVYEKLNKNEYNKEPADPNCTCNKLYSCYFPSPCVCTEDMKQRNKCCTSCYITQSRSCHRDCGHANHPYTASPDDMPYAKGIML